MVRMMESSRFFVRTESGIPLILHVWYHGVCMGTSALSWCRSWTTTCLLRPSGMPIHLNQSIFVDKTDIVWGDTDNGTVLVVQVQDILMPSAKCIPPRSPKLCESSCCRSRYVSQRVETEPIDNRSEDDVSEDDNGAFPPDVMQERDQPRTDRTAALDLLRV
jgi:hypothetical protein